MSFSAAAMEFAASDSHLVAGTSHPDLQPRNSPAALEAKMRERSEKRSSTQNSAKAVWFECNNEMFICFKVSFLGEEEGS